MPGLSQSNCGLSFFPPTWTYLSILYHASGAAPSLGEETLLSLLLFPLQSLRNGGNVYFSVSSSPRNKSKRRHAGLGIHVTNGPNWCHAPNVRNFVWTQCLEQFMIGLMCPFKQKAFMEPGSLDVFTQDNEHCLMREEAVFHARYICLDCLRLTNRQPKSWMQVPVSRS